ncbi:MAG: thioredoxin family protein [Thermodesulfobacteriota bacterium]
MKIEVLGTGCAKCQRAEAMCKEAANELGIEAEVTKVSKIGEIAKRGVLATPAVVVEGKVKCVGRIPKLEEVKQWLQETST